MQVLERVMGQLVVQGGSSGGSKNYKPHVGCDVTMHELEGACEVSHQSLQHRWLRSAVQCSAVVG